METIKAGHTFAFLQFQGVINDKGTFINKVNGHRKKKNWASRRFNLSRQL